MSKQLPLSPTSVNQYIKYLLENDNKLRKLYISGEASNVKYHTNGNIYFSIKDDNAAINCIMFKNYQQAMEEKIIEGDKIEIIGNIYAYTKMGQYSINVFKMRKMGQGDLYQKFLELKNKLQKEGYFDEKNKKPFPMFPKKIGVITSPTGAAVKDIITTIQRRYDLAKIVIIPTLVQGENAKHSIAENIRRANEIGDFDSLIVGRGGGSIEDLWAFNEIEVAQAIYNSKIPIISAVGHETDFTIADFVADKRAPTPTGAAEMITPNKEELLNSVRNNMNTIRRNLENLIKFNKEKLKSIRENQYFKNPLLNILTDFNFLEERFISQSKILDSEIKTLQSNIKMHLENSKNNILESINKNKKDLNHQKENLDNLNPLNILSKGYAVVQKENQYLKSVKNIKITDEITIKLLDGTLITEVKKIEQEKNN